MHCMDMFSWWIFAELHACNSCSRAKNITGRYFLRILVLSLCNDYIVLYNVFVLRTDINLQIK